VTIRHATDLLEDEPHRDTRSHPCVVSMRGACPISKLCSRSADTLDASVTSQKTGRRILHPKESLYRAGDRLENLYLLRSGSLKVRITSYEGIEHITSFALPGNVVGYDGIGTGLHECDAVALEHSLVCVIPFSGVLTLCCRDSSANRVFQKLMASEASYCRRLPLILNHSKSDVRIAHFLAELAARMQRNGYSSREFALAMTRGEIANHLGMKHETVSRIFTKLHNARILEISRRQLKITNIDALKKIGKGLAPSLSTPVDHLPSRRIRPELTTF